MVSSVTPHYDVVAVGDALVDVIAPASEDFLAREGLAKGSRDAIGGARSAELYGRMAPGMLASGGSAANTLAGVVSLGGRAAFLGKVGADDLGKVFAHDLKAVGVDFDVPPLAGGQGTGRCLVNVAPDGERTMRTWLGDSLALGVDDIDPRIIQGSEVVLLEGYSFQSESGRAIFDKCAGLARAAGTRIALALSDRSVIERHRTALLAFMLREQPLVIANAVEAMSLAETDDLEAAVDALRDRVETFVVTRGETGATLVRGAERREVPADAVERVVDTTGAGDQYAAGFLFGLARGLTLADCGRLGALAAAEVISHLGPRPETDLKTLAASRGLLEEER
jgi:sugar/nucleoside kinase (ribokinase family)